MAELAAGARVGNHVLLEPLGRGGMGVVFRAVDRTTRRDVAIKVLAPSAATSAEALERMVREAQAAASVDDPGIVKIFSAGMHGASPYLVFELMRGGSVADVLRRRGRLPWRDAALLAARVARALAALHDRGVVHRDLKPHNILLDEEGRAKIADLGLAWSLELSDAVSLTATGEVLGTPHFLSPEQAEAKRATGASDLYALGATLFMLLTGETPFTGTPVELLTKHRRETPPRPSRLVPGIPAKLDALVLLLLAKRPEDRPPDGRSVAEELEALAADPLAKGPRRSRGVRAVLASGAVLGTLLAVLVATRRPPPRETPALTGAAGRARPAPATGPAPSDETARARLVRTWGDARLHAAARVTALAALGPAEVLVGDEEGLITRWNIERGEPIAVVGSEATTGPVPAMGVIDGGARAAVASGDGPRGALRVWDLARGKVERELAPHGAPRVRALAVAPDASYFATGDAEGGLSIWSAAGERRIAHVPGAHAGGVNVVVAAPRVVFTGGADGAVRAWDPGTGLATASTPPGPTEPITALARSPDGTRLAAGTAEGKIVIGSADLAGGRHAATHGSLVRALLWVDDYHVASIANDTATMVWDFGEGRPKVEKKGGHLREPLALIALGAERLLTGGKDGMLVVHALPGAKDPVPVRPGSAIGRLALHPDGRTFFSGDRTGLVHRYDLPHAPHRQELARGSDVDALAVSPDGDRLAWADGAKVLVVPCEPGGPERAPRFTAPGRVVALAWRGDAVLATLDDGRVLSSDDPAAEPDAGADAAATRASSSGELVALSEELAATARGRSGGVRERGAGALVATVELGPFDAPRALRFRAPRSLLVGTGRSLVLEYEIGR